MREKRLRRWIVFSGMHWIPLKQGVTEEDVEKFKGSIEAQQINGLQAYQEGFPAGGLQTFADNPNKIANLIRMYTSVTREDIMRVYNQYIR
jgi:zinc protease